MKKVFGVIVSMLIVAVIAWLMQSGVIRLQWGDNTTPAEPTALAASADAEATPAPTPTAEAAQEALRVEWVVEDNTQRRLLVVRGLDHNCPDQLAQAEQLVREELSGLTSQEFIDTALQQAAETGSAATAHYARLLPGEALLCDEHGEPITALTVATEEESAWTLRRDGAHLLLEDQKEQVEIAHSTLRADGSYEPIRVSTWADAKAGAALCDEHKAVKANHVTSTIKVDATNLDGVFQVARGFDKNLLGAWCAAADYHLVRGEWTYSWGVSLKVCSHSGTDGRADRWVAPAARPTVPAPAATAAPTVVPTAPAPAATPTGTPAYSADPTPTPTAPAGTPAYSADPTPTPTPTAVPTAESTRKPAKPDYAPDPTATPPAEPSAQPTSAFTPSGENADNVMGDRKQPRQDNSSSSGNFTPSGESAQGTMGGGRKSASPDAQKPRDESVAEVMGGRSGARKDDDDDSSSSGGNASNGGSSGGDGSGFSKSGESGVMND